MAAVALSVLRTRARERADMPVAGFVPDSATGIDAWINEGIQKLHEMLVEAYASDYVEKQAAFTCTGADSVALPADFYKLLGVDLNSSDGTVVTLTPFPRGMRNVYKNSLNDGLGYRTRFKLSGASTLRLLPAPRAGTTGVVWYSPVAPVLVASGDTVDFPNGWERYVVLYTAIQMKLKQESSITELQNDLLKMELDLRNLADRRDLSTPSHAVDVDQVEAADWSRWFP